MPQNVGLELVGFRHFKLDVGRNPATLLFRLLPQPLLNLLPELLLRDAVQVARLGDFDDGPVGPQGGGGVAAAAVQHAVAFVAEQGVLVPALPAARGQPVAAAASIGPVLLADDEPVVLEPAAMTPARLWRLTLR